MKLRYALLPLLVIVAVLPFVDRAPRRAPAKQPNDWFQAQRAYPGTEIDLASLSLAREQARALEATAGPRAAAWIEAGPTNIGGRITALAVAAGAAQKVFAGVADGGIFRSVDGGVSWVPIFDEVGIPSIGALTVAPSNPNTLWVGTGESNGSGDSFAGEGVFRSTDGGTSWESRGLPASRHIGRIAVDPTNANRVFVAATGALFSTSPDRGVYRTTDAGLNWERVLFVSDSTGAIDVALDPTNPSRVYAAMWERIRHPKSRKAGGVGSGIHRSTDGGTTWQRLSSGLPAQAANVGRIGLAISPSDPQRLYAIYADDPGYFLGSYKSTNGGDSWTRMNDGALSDLFSSFGWYFGQIRVSPTDANRIYALGLDIWRSTNGGTSWSTVSSGVHVDQHDLWIDPAAATHLIAGCDGGVYTTTNGGSSWTHRNTLPISQFYAGTIDASNPERIYGGLQDNGTVRTQTGAVNDWEEIYGGDGFYCLVDPTNPDVIYAEYQYGGLGKSVDGGFWFDDATAGINSGDRRNWSTPVVMDPTNNTKLYYGTYRLWRTTNGAGSWSAISSDLTGGSGGGSLVYGTITTIAVSASDPARIYAGTDDARVWTSSNAGGAWQNVSAGLPNRWVTRVAVDPADPLVAYVAQSGYRQDIPTPHLHRTTNAGATWAAIDAGLPDAPVNVVVVDPDQTSTLYVGTDTGVYVSYDTGASWAPLASGMPILVVHDLKLHAETRSLVAFTHSRSAYRSNLGPPSNVAEAETGAGPRLDAPIPNPVMAGGTTRLAFETSGILPSRLDLYDVSGRLRRSLARGLGASGQVAFDGRDDRGAPLPAGTYFARLTEGARSVSTRITLLP